MSGLPGAFELVLGSLAPVPRIASDPTGAAPHVRQSLAKDGARTILG